MGIRIGSALALSVPSLVLVAVVLGLSIGTATGDVIITKVLPNVSTATDRGDTVELFNTGPGGVDLTDYVLTDLDPDGVNPADTFAPLALGVPPLGEDEFAVVVFVDSTGGTLFQFWETNYGLLIHAPLATAASSFLGSEHDQLILTDDTITPLDFVAWTESSLVPSGQTDLFEDLASMTPPTADYGLVQGGAAWAGPDDIPDLNTFRTNSIDLGGLDSVTTYGGAVIQRNSAGGVFEVANPDGPAQWTVVPRHEGMLGNFPEDLPTMAGIRPLRMAGRLATWAAELESTNAPWRRIARDQNAAPAEFVSIPQGVEHTDFEAVLALAIASDWEECFDAATALGYEVVEFLDFDSSRTYHILRERVVPGAVGFRGQGTYVFNSHPIARSYLVIEVPHPVNDLRTGDQGGLAFPQVRAHVMLIAGSHRNNHVDSSNCDGMFNAMEDYHISDVAHHPDNYFHTAHKYLEANLPDPLFIQLHGFCCPGVDPHMAISDDTVISDGLDHVPGMSDFARLFADAIEDQNFFANDGSMSGDLTTAGLYGEEVFSLGGTTNLQGRVTNGVVIGTECMTAAVSSTARYIHVEQDPDVREEPQHVIDALEAALQSYETPLLIEMSELTATAANVGDLPVISWRTISEVDNAGFHVYLAESTDSRGFTVVERLTDSIIPAAGSGDGAAYSFTHQLAVSGENDDRYYFVSDIDLGGMERLHGPVALAIGSSAQLGDWILH